MRIQDVQDEVGKWHKRNFPDATPTDPLVIIMEELGETCHAHMKLKEGIRVDENHSEKLKDGVADIFIALCGFCSLSHIDLEDCVRQTLPEVMARDWVKYRAEHSPSDSTESEVSDG